VNLGASDDRLPTPTSPQSGCALSQDLRSPGLLLKKSRLCKDSSENKVRHEQIKFGTVIKEKCDNHN
jgi:hypothetical protein